MQKGFSTIELLIAFAIATLFISAAMMVSFSGQTAGVDTMVTNTGLQKTATRLASDIRETMLDWGFIPADANADPYTFKSTAEYMSNCRKNISSHSDWDTTHTGRQRLDIDFGTALINMEEAMNQGPGGCDPTDPGTFEYIEDTGWDVSPSAVSSKGRDIATLVDGGTTYAIVTLHLNGNGPDLMIIDVSTDPQNPSVEIDVDISPKGYDRIALFDKYAYVTRMDSNHIDVIDLTTPTNPVWVKEVVIPDIPTTALARSIFYYNNKLYVGTEYLSCPPICPGTQNNEFHVYDLSSDPLNPVHAGRLNVNHHVNDIFVRGSWAYLATSDDDGEMMVVDISNPGSMQHPDVTGRKFNPSQNYDGLSIYVLGDYAYFGRKAAANGHFDFYKISIVNPNSITATKWRRLNDDVLGMVVQGSNAFLITQSKNFHVWDILKGSGTDIVSPGACTNIIDNLPNLMLGITFRNNYIYTISENQATLLTFRNNPNNVCAP